MPPKQKHESLYYAEEEDGDYADLENEFEEQDVTFQPLQRASHTSSSAMRNYNTPKIQGSKKPIVKGPDQAIIVRVLSATKFAVLFPHVTGDKLVTLYVNGIDAVNFKVRIKLHLHVWY